MNLGSDLSQILQGAENVDALDGQVGLGRIIVDKADGAIGRACVSQQAQQNPRLPAPRIRVCRPPPSIAEGPRCMYTRFKYLVISIRQMANGAARITKLRGTDKTEPNSTQASPRTTA